MQSLRMAKEKNAAAVALGRISAAKRTPERQAQLTARLMAWKAGLSPHERSAISRKAARTARQHPRWVVMATGLPAAPIDLATESALTSMLWCANIPSAPQRASFQ